jgi:RNA polymerase-binding transcription factor DksA
MWFNRKRFDNLRKLFRKEQLSCFYPGANHFDLSALSGTKSGTVFYFTLPNKIFRTMHLMKNGSTSQPKQYPQHVLDEFDSLISKKLDEAQLEFASLSERLRELNENGSSNLLTESADAVALEELNLLMSRQRALIQNLSNALVRVRNKTYGICKATGQLIPVERLRAVPHTTLSLEAKNKRVA